MDTPRNQSDEGSSSGSRSNDDDKGKKPVLEPPLPEAEFQDSTLADPDGDSESDYFLSLLDALKADKKVHPDATAIPAGAFCKVLVDLGMSPEVEEDELRNMLMLSGYADEDGALNFERFLVFADDFKLLESLRKYKASSLKGKLDRGPLGSFFGDLETGEVLGFLYRDFVDAFSDLQLNLDDGDGDSLERYAGLQRDIPISFEQFSKALSKEHGNMERRTRHTTLFRRTLTLDLGVPLGRVMGFVSTYTRSAMRKKLR